MRPLALACLALPQLWGVSLESHGRHGNRVMLRLSEGAAELEWITSSTFRFRRVFAGELPERTGPEREFVPVRITDSPAALSLSSTYLVVDIGKNGLRLGVRKADGAPLMADETEARRQDGVIRWERSAAPGVRYYGLGARTGATLNVRGMLARDAMPFFFCTAGYGERHVAPGHYDFDLARLHRDRYRIDIRGADRIDYYFFYGPTPKEIFEEQSKVAGTKLSDPEPGDSPRRMVEKSLSGVLLPASVISKLLPTELRPRLAAYFAAYTLETQDRGFPILHALPFQFPSDAEADRYPGVFMVGDELLVALERSAYLPMGIWTNLRTNQVARGRQAIALEREGEVFVRNGSIVPLGGAPMELHYFPKLGAEFFVYEEEAGDYSQMHAAPAADAMRLEIESKVAREYEWVVHQIESVRRVTAGEVECAEVKDARHLRDRTWFYDAARHNLHVRARVAAGQDHIVNLNF